MKKTFFSLFLCLIIFSAHSQITKNNWLVGGSGSLYSYKGDYTAYNPIDPNGYRAKSKYTEIDLSINAGYFFIDKSAIGVRGSMTSVKGELSEDGSGSTNVQQYFIGPFARYYFLEFDRPFNILTEVNYQYGFYGGIADGKFNQFSALAGPVLYFNTVVGVEFLLGYSYNKRDVKDLSKETQKGFKIAIGFQIHLEKD